MARRSTEVCTTSGSSPASRSSSPPRVASSRPFADRSTSTQPVNRFLAFHSLSPCRSSTNVPTFMRGRLSADFWLAIRRIGEVSKGFEVAQRLAALDPPVPLLLDRGPEAELERLVETLVGVGEDAAQDAVDILRSHS